METTGKLTGASRTFDGRGIILTFEVDASAAGQIENLQNQDKLKIKAVRYTQKRSLDANAYLEDFGTQREQGMGLFIWSRTKGSGKTRIAAGIANELMKSYAVKFAVSLG